MYDARAKRGISQARAASEIGVARRAYVRWENNKVRPNADSAEAISAALDLPVEAILDPTLAHVRTNQDKRVGRLLSTTADLRKELAACHRENSELRRQIARLAS